ncbi:anti-sigma factor [Leifsonia sp. AG29]|uniref:anti-sigma factor n=1 Tax=Leifsonia sp. AG29 TaxID=2598860 RepID=UPI00131B6638|nr:anti-sigma factor [Leifsonia sp. AG29]
MSEQERRNPAGTDGRHPDGLGFELGAADEQEAREFEDLAAQLGLAAEPVEPRPELKAAIMAKIAATPQLPAEQAAPPVARPAAAADDAVGLVTPLSPSTSAEERARRRWFQRPGLILASAAAAILLFIGGAFLGSSLAGTDSYQRQQATALAQINAAPDVQRATAPVSGGGTATLVWSGKLGTSALIADDLPPLPQGKTYELWYIRDGAATPAGTMQPAGTGSTWRVLTGRMAAGDTVGVTVEPRGGSDKPTTKPIVAIAS